MICKKDVIDWFQKLESYKRIDTMCNLLNICLPFELRFLGTCLEELGRRDSQLRGMELRVNNPQDLATDMVACQKGEPTDKKIRRKMALYLALIRACNRTCVTEIYRTLDGWGERDFLSITDPDTLQELLLVYTMAANHPVFSVEQKLKCTEIFGKIKENKLVSEHQSMPSYIEQVLSHNQLHHQDLRQHLQPSHQEFLQQQVPHAMHLAQQPHSQLLTAATTHPNIQMPIPVPFHQGLAMDQHMISANIIPDSNPIGHPTWCRPYPPTIASHEHPQQPASPSQQSSPSSSRNTSPNRNSTNMMSQSIQTQQQPARNMPQRIGVSLKNVRRPSAETTPPPMGQQHQSMMQHDTIMAPTVKHMEDVANNSERSGNELQNLIRNGYKQDPYKQVHHSRHKANNFISPHQQQHSQQSPVNQHFPTIPNFSVNPPLAYSMQSMSIVDGGAGGSTHVMDAGLLGSVINSNKSAGSDSGSSHGSSGEATPPDTPTLSNTTTNVGGLRLNPEQHQAQQQKHHQQQHLNYSKQIAHVRLNGRSEKMLSSSSPLGGNSVNASPNLVYVQSQVLANTHQPLPQQQSQPLFGGDIILAPGGNAGATNLIQTSLANNNSAAGNSIAVANTSSNTASSNNNIVSTGVMLTANPGLLTSQQYVPYNYHIASQHHATASRPPLMPHTPPLTQTPFRIVQNCDILYQAYHQAPPNMAFLSGPAPPGAPSVTLRSSNAAPANTNVSTVVSQLQQQQPPQQQVAPTAIPNAAILATSPYSAQAVTASVNKPISCYNCGSQSHNGRECQEASMDDVTRSAIYKLDYSVASNTTPAVGQGAGICNTGGGGSSGGVGCTADTLQTQQQQQQHHQKQHNIDAGGTNLVSTPSAVTALQSAAPVSALNSK